MRAYGYLLGEIRLRRLLVRAKEKFISGKDLLFSLWLGLIFIFSFVPSEVLPTFGGLGFLLIGVSLHDVGDSGVSDSSFLVVGLA